MGWLGWTWEYARREDVNAISLAMEGRGELLETIFGSTPKAGKGRPMSGERFRAFAKRHNRTYQSRTAKGSVGEG